VSDWFKFSAHFFGSRKVIRAGRNGRDIFAHVLCCNAQRDANGRIPAGDIDPWFAAHTLGLNESEAIDGVTRAVTADLIRIEGDFVVIVGWDENWSRRPASEAERARNYRLRKKESTVDHGIRHESYVTNHERSDASRRDREIDRERDPSDARSATKSPDSLSAHGKPRKTQTPAGAAQPLSSAWEPSDAAVAFARSRELDITHEVSQFRLNAAARGHLFVDPHAAFEKFMAGSRDAGKKPKHAPGSTTTKPKRQRLKLESGVELEEDDNGQLQPIGNSQVQP
jgi:hypothetical protein